MLYIAMLWMLFYVIDRNIMDVMDGNVMDAMLWMLCHIQSCYGLIDG